MSGLNAPRSMANELLEQLRSEIDAITRERNLYKLQRDELERKRTGRFEFRNCFHFFLSLFVLVCLPFFGCSLFFVELKEQKIIFLSCAGFCSGLTVFQRV